MSPCSKGVAQAQTHNLRCQHGLHWHGCNYPSWASTSCADTKVLLTLTNRSFQHLFTHIMAEGSCCWKTARVMTSRVVFGAGTVMGATLHAQRQLPLVGPGLELDTHL